jgi:hypothetical protein
VTGFALQQQWSLDFIGILFYSFNKKNFSTLPITSALSSSKILIIFGPLFKLMFFNWSFPSKKFIKINETNLGACGRIQK